jgi:2-polyprenyl-6-hydroxyphenyl methylase/3-demethylubiquinone-9 3-methyltransferase
LSASGRGIQRFEKFMKQLTDLESYHHRLAVPCHAHAYLLPTVTSVVEEYCERNGCERRLFDLGCGNGSVGAHFANRGFSVVGVDPSAEGVAHANSAFPELSIDQGSAYDDLAGKYGTFPVVISLEVVEHVYSPREYARNLFALVKPGGMAVVSTPYHGYLKNLAIAASNSFDGHVNPLKDHGHIKFWSRRTLSSLLREAGFVSFAFHRVGRIPMLAKSMIAVAEKA